MAKKDQINKGEQLDLTKALEAIEKKFGKEILSNGEDIEKVTSGCLSLDLALGGGWAKGRIIECYGWESSGKTTLALELAREIQKLGKAVGYIDMEYAVDLQYARDLGVDTSKNKWLLTQPADGEEGFEVAREMARHKEFGLVVIDSVSALIPRSIIQGEAGDAKMGVQARLMSQMIPTLLSVIKESGCIVLFINQLREKIGVVWGNPTTTSGGNALKFYASQRVEVTKVTTNKDEGVALSNKTRVKVTKNKVAPPYGQCEFNIVFGQGIDKLMDIIDLGVELEVIKKAGSWYSYDTTKLGQGTNGVKDVLQDNPELVEEIRSRILEKI